METRKRGIDASRMQHLKVNVHNSVEEAPNYNEVGGYGGAVLVSAAIVRKGTVDNKSTVDLVFEDADGNKFVAMTTGKLLKMVTDLIGEN